MTIFSDTPEEFTQKKFIENFCNNISCYSYDKNQIIREAGFSQLKAIFASRLSALLQTKVAFLINNLKKITGQQAAKNSDAFSLPQNFTCAENLLFSHFEIN